MRKRRTSSTSVQGPWSTGRGLLPSNSINLMPSSPPSVGVVPVAKSERPNCVVVVVVFGTFSKPGGGKFEVEAVVAPPEPSVAVSLPMVILFSLFSAAFLISPSGAATKQVKCKFVRIPSSSLVGCGVCPSAELSRWICVKRSVDSSNSPRSSGVLSSWTGDEDRVGEFEDTRYLYRC